MLDLTVHFAYNSAMSYHSIDAIQKALTEQVFHYAQDSKKAAGRALGTLIEVITYYTLRSWGFRDSVGIERSLPEFANPEITHNVEYSTHPILQQSQHVLDGVRLPVTASKIRKLIWGTDRSPGNLDKDRQLFTTDGIIRNSCVIAETPTGFYVAHLDSYSEGRCAFTVSLLHHHPYAMFECKRVGVEEGMRKGPQTIEKAKQGAYVARSVSALQKYRRADGRVGGVIEKADGSLEVGVYAELIDHLIQDDDPELLSRFTLTVGVVSNHGNWFTALSHNKELKVLAHSYDWLLFLTDEGLSDFVNELLLSPAPSYAAVQQAFRTSYSGNTATRNRFTKVQMDAKTDALLQAYFQTHSDRIKGWFNIISPRTGSIDILQKELQTLRGKDWSAIINR